VIAVGFTGTQAGMTPQQRARLGQLLQGRQVEFHHGDCIGADAEAHEVALAFGARIVIHPPTNEAKRAFCWRADQVLDPKPYLMRNRAIVRATGRLIAAPKEMSEQLRSGTWMTTRFARNLGRPIWILWPDGTCRVENAPKEIAAGCAA
jgi:hypothetical protein